jgi:integrase
MNSQQIPLGVTDPADQAAAWAKLHEMMKAAAREAVAEAQPAKPVVRTGAIPALVREFLAARSPCVEPGTLKSYGQHLGWLAAAFPDEAPAGIDPAELARAAARVATWGDTHRANVLATCGAFLRWCGREVDIPLPPKASRGADSVIPEAVYLRCLRETTGDFHQLLRFLWLTGCRPGEATALTAEAVGWDSGTIKVKEHKTRKKGKTRVIYLADEALQLLREQRKAHDAGLLFRGMRERKFSLQAMTMRFERLSEKVGRTVTSYMFRHTWATRALAAGVPAAQVAAMLGHTSTAMVFKHYAHLCEEAGLLRQQAERVANRQAG